MTLQNKRKSVARICLYRQALTAPSTTRTDAQRVNQQVWHTHTYTHTGTRVANEQLRCRSDWGKNRWAGEQFVVGVWASQLQFFCSTWNFWHFRYLCCTCCTFCCCSCCLFLSFWQSNYAWQSDLRSSLVFWCFLFGIHFLILFLASTRVFAN